MNALLAVVAVLGVSASGPLMAATPAPALAIAFWRNAAATIVLAPVAAARSRAEYRSLDRRHLLLTLAAGVFLAGHFAAWVGSLQLTSVAAATALVTTQLVWVVLIDRWRGRPVAARVLLGCGISVAGVLVVSGVDLTVSARALAGDGLAVLGGLFAALYLSTGERVRTRLSTTGYTTLCYGTCAVVLLVASLAAGVDLVGLDARAWLLVGAVTVCAQLLGHSLLNHLLAVMSPLLISLLLLLEVPGAALLAAVALGQSPPAGVYAGLALVLAGLVVVVLGRRPSEQQPLEV
ncbi:MAG: DMT family transporter [Aeromicrobium erythreum]